MDLDKFYTQAEKFIYFGPAFLHITYAGYVGKNEAIIEAIVPDNHGIFAHTLFPETIISPILLDNACRNTILLDYHQDGYICVPRKITESILYRPFVKHEKVYAYTKLLEQEGDLVHFDIEIIDANNLLCMVIRDLVMVRIDKDNDDFELL